MFTITDADLRPAGVGGQIAEVDIMVCLQPLTPTYTRPAWTGDVLTPTYTRQGWTNTHFITRPTWAL